MHQTIKRPLSIIVSLGAVLLSLRLRLYIVAVDEKNLLISGHWLSALIWGIATLCLVFAALAAIRTKEAGSISITGPVAALGEGLFAGILLLSMLAMAEPVSLLEKARNAVGYLTSVCLLVGAYRRAVGKSAFFGIYCALCLFFALYLVNVYRVWSSNPQLMDYFFPLLACIALTLLSYQNAALSLGIGSRRLWLASGLLAICFGIGAVYGSESMLLYIGGAVWALTNLLGADAASRNRYEERER